VNAQAVSYMKILGFVNRTFKPLLVSRHRRIQIYKAFTRPTLSNDNEAWTI